MLTCTKNAVRPKGFAAFLFVRKRLHGFYTAGARSMFLRKIVQRGRGSGCGGKAAGIATQDEVQELAGATAASGIRLTDQTPAGCTVYADQSLLLINLIGNSIKYGVPGGPAYKVCRAS